MAKQGFKQVCNSEVHTSALPVRQGMNKLAKLVSKSYIGKSLKRIKGLE